MSYVGAALSPRETKKLVLGRGSYVGDLTAPGLLHAAFVRSPHAHARIRGIETGAARRQPGIVAVLTGHDLARLTAPLRIAPPIEGLLPMEMPTLPTDKVRFVGDVVACVIGEQRYQVEDACALVDVAYEPLPAVVDPEHAQDSGLPLVDETIPANRAYQGVFAHGDVAAALGAADQVVAARFHQGRQTHVPLEPRGCLASWQPGEETLTFWHSTQIPHPMRSALAARLGIAESAVRVIGMMVPGAYRLRDYRYAITAVLTNKCPAGPYRAPMLICSWVTEGTIDAVARALDLDPVAVRRKNMLAESDLPYTTATRLVYRSVYPRDTLERALEAFDYEAARRSRDDARAAGRIAGIGVATYIEPNTYGSEVYKTAGVAGAGHDAAIVRVAPR